MAHTIAVILPAYNEGNNLGTVIDDLKRLQETLGYDIIVIDDGSTDATGSVAHAKQVQLVRHKRNKGLGETFRTAVEIALRQQYEIMVFFDADNQFDVTDISRLIEPIQAGKADVVLGSRFTDGAPKDMPVAKLLGNRVLARFISFVTGIRVRDVACGFRAYNREALYRLNIRGDFTYTQEVVLDLLFKKMIVVEVPIHVRYFKDRVSHISSNLFTYGWRVLKIMLRTIRDYQPMKFFGTIGAAIFLAGAMLDIWMLWFYVQTGSFSPYKIVGFTGAFLNFLGVTIWFIGLLADMLNRIRKDQEEALYYSKKRYHA